MICWAPSPLHLARHSPVYKKADPYQRRDAAQVFTRCTYPTSNFEPTDCDCSFVCTNGFVRCGASSCINPNTQTCVSGVPVTRSAKRGHFECAPGQTACSVNQNAWECLDTANDLESCGGCIGNGGVDCSDLPGADQTSCQSGHCVISTCLRGYNLSTDGHCLP